MTTIEKGFAWLGWFACASIFVTILIFIYMPAKITAYSLSGGQGTLYIEKHVDWSGNNDIMLDRSITIQEATLIVRDLNATIK